nr:EOG090X0KAD [Polyphemus pediculus]
MASPAISTFTKINKVIRLNRHGCTNRPFYHIVVQKNIDTQEGDVIEQVGSYDPMPNINNQKIVAFNYERIQHWIGAGAGISEPVATLLGLAGFLPVHPKTVIDAWRIRAEPPRERKVQAFKGVAPPPTNPKY